MKNKIVHILLTIVLISFGALSCEKNKESLPIITTSPIDSISIYSAISGGSVLNEGGSIVTQKGVVWSTDSNPTISDNLTIDGSGVGSFNSKLSGLLSSTTYYVRAYATNSTGTAYGDELSFTTTAKNDTLPTVQTNAATNIWCTKASLGGHVLQDGGSQVSQRGIVWGTNPSPTMLDNIAINGSDTGKFISSITGLTPGTSYFIRAFAVNSIGTAYGNEQHFTTSDTLATLGNTLVDSIKSYAAIAYGDVSSDGGSSVSQRGIVWSTNPNPTLLDNNINCGSGIGPFSCNLIGLASNSTYYVRSYAINSLGTIYSNEVYFNTTSGPSYPPGTVFCTSSATAIIEVTSASGKVWMDRNLGANRAATNSTDTLAAGDLYQWGRRADGHQCRSSGTTLISSSIDQPFHNDFILSQTSPSDWRIPQNPNLWQGVNGTNNPCPTGFRLPTGQEWYNETNFWSTNNAAGAFNNPLKLVLNGRRGGHTGNIHLTGSEGYYWSSSVFNNSAADNLLILNVTAGVITSTRASGLAVRCIKN